MSENASKETQTRTKMLTINDDDRLRYFGFDVGPDKIGEFFKDKSEEAKLIGHVREKRERHEGLRDTSNFREERVSQAERYTIVGACAVVILSFFLPFTPLIGGYVETRTEVQVTSVGSEVTTEVIIEDVADVADVADGVADASDGSVADGAQDSDVTTESSESNEATETTSAGEADTDDESTTASASAATSPRRRVSGFQDLAVKTTKTRIDTDPYSWSSMQLITSMGSYSSQLFSSGIVVILSAILLGVFMLMTLAIPGYIIFQALTLKGDPDTVALQLKATMHLAWIPMLVFLALIVLAMIGGSYGFDTSGILKQFGESYSIDSLLGLLNIGFFVSLAGFLFAGSKSVEI